MTARRVKSLHFNLGNKNVPFHREHRSKKNRTKNYKNVYSIKYKKRLEELKIKDLLN